MTTWDEFTANLANDLTRLSTSDTVVFYIRQRIIQFRQHPTLLHASVVSNEFLRPDHQLNRSQQARLAELSWQPPNPPEERNWVKDLPWPFTTSDSRQFADLLALTISDVLGAADPGEIEFQAWNDDTGQQLVLTVTNELKPAR